MKRIVATLLSVLLVAPSVVLAQQPKAGIVTTLEGNVTARRVALPETPLKFRDDVLLQDTISTGDKSLARMLLGGKAVVTVRERSVLTITEIPGRSVIELETGKFALAVAREKMRPGEEIQIRTPNAVAGVRGTVVITEVNRQTAQLGRGAAGVVTNFYVLRGNIIAQPLDISTRVPIGTPLPIATMHAYSGAGAAAPRVTPVPPEQVGQITSGLKPSGPKGGGSAGQEQVREQAVETAVTLIGTLTGTGSGTQLAAIVAPATSNLLASTSTTPVVVPTNALTQVCTGDASLCGAAASTSLASPLTTPLQTFDTPFASTSPLPLFQFDSAAVVQIGENLDLFRVRNGASVSLAGPLAAFTNSVLFTPRSLLDMVGGSLTSTSPDALFSFDPSFVFAADLLRLVAASTLTLGGSLLQLTDTQFDATTGNRAFIAIADGSNLITTGTNEPLLSFDTSQVSAARNFFSASSNSTAPFSSMTLSGPFLNASSTTLRNGDPSTNVFSFLFIGDGAQVTSTSALPFVTLNNSTLDTSADFLSLRRSTASTPSRLTLAGPLLVATETTLNHTSLGFASSFSTQPSACCSGFFVGQGGQLTSTTSQALIQLTSSSVIGNDAQSGGNFFNIADTFVGAPATEVVASSSVSLAGPLLRANASTITELFNLVRIRRSSLSSTSTSPLIDLTDVNVTLGGTDPTTNNAAIGSLLNVVASDNAGTVALPASVTLAGPLARLIDTTFLAGGSNVVTVFNGATYVGGGAGAMIQLDTSTLTGFNLLSVFGLGGPGGTTKSSVTLQGPVLSATNSTLTLGASVVGVFNGSTLTSTTTAPLLQLAGTNLTAGTTFSGGEVLQVNGGTSPALVTLNGPVLTTDPGSSLNLPGALFGSFLGGQLVVNGSTDALFSLNGGTHAFGSGAPPGEDSTFVLNGLATETALDEESGTTLDLGTRRPVQAAGSLLETTGATVTTNKLVRLDTALLEASAPILNFRAGSNITVANDAIDLIQKAKLTSSDINPLVRLDASTLTILNGAAVAVRGGSFLNVRNDLFAINNGSTVNVNNGPFLLVSGGSVVRIQNALINFGGVGNTVNITNNFCSVECATIGGLRVLVQNGAVGGQSSIFNPIQNPTGGTINIPATAAHIVLDGPGSRVQIGTSP